MYIGCPKEIRSHEYRVALLPFQISEYRRLGHTILVESEAGLGAGYSDKDYEKFGALIVDRAELFGSSEMIIKVKGLVPEEYSLLKENQVLLSYQHLAADHELLKVLLEKRIYGLAYETISVRGSLVCLSPMSAIAGRLSILESAKYLQRQFGGKGLLLSGVPGVLPAKIMIIGGGVVGINAAQLAVGLGAEVVLLDVNQERLEYIDQIFGMRVRTLKSNRENILSMLDKVDVVIGAVLLPGFKTPKLLLSEDLSNLEEGSLLVDVAIDQGGCFETSVMTTYDDPVFTVDGVLHYCVGNIPGSVARTASLALSNAILPFGLEIANKGILDALENEFLLSGLNTAKGECTNRGVAESLGIEYVPWE